ncbi:SugE protein [Salmonella enterica subsp. enterica]|uniref:SugE protein n=1 Tax=Salmonella enterica I TaxID=59201 RepID=A0A447MZE5_SALET|nr:SugE protein [Salmonella enterica subsp. enterica]
MSWIILLIAGLLEVVWAVGLKYTHGFSRLTPQYYHHYGHGYQYGVTFLGNENAACWNGVRHLDRHRRRWGRQSPVSFCWASLPHRRVCSVLA